VVTSFGKVTGRILQPGLNTIVPIANSTLTYNTKKVIYETTSADRQHQSQADYKDYPVDTNTKDGQQVNIYYTVRFSIDPTKVTWVAQNIGDENNVVEKIVKTESRIWVRNIPREFEAEHLYTGNVQEIQTIIEDKLRPVFSANGILLDKVGIREIKFTQDYVSAIEAKQIEFVKIQTEKNKAEQAKAQKEARITQAEGQKREQELLRESITDEIIQKLWIEKWDGKLPVVMGEGANIMDITSLLTTQK
jgi:regulator of protease activity HflC (stomatin/prohibitin superfamily)